MYNKYEFHKKKKKRSKYYSLFLTAWVYIYNRTQYVIGIMLRLPIHMTSCTHTGLTDNNCSYKYTSV